MSLRPPAALLGAALFGVAACASSPSPPPLQVVDDPPTAGVRCALFFAGDGGDALYDRSPLLQRMRHDVEEWAGALGRDSAVVVLFLGDNVYSTGLHPPGHPERPRDERVLQSQAAVASGPMAHRYRVRTFFIAGNHDWGRDPAPEGLERVRLMAAYVDTLREEGYDVAFVPEPGTPVPHVVDLACGQRLILLDTAWWIQGADEAGKAALLDSIRGAVREAGERDYFIAAHHPLRSGGPHGDLVTFWKRVYLFRLLYRSGALVQDLNSPPYVDLRDGLRAIFREIKPPVAYLGAHDHNLQVIEAPYQDVTAYQFVAGSMSKITDVGPAEGMLFRADAPGYMRLTFHDDGAIHLAVIAAPKEFLHCEGDDAARARCVQDGLAAFRTAFALRIR